eukprot:14267-Hanusia_phi.AAC.1
MPSALVANITLFQYSATVNRLLGRRREPQQKSDSSESNTAIHCALTTVQAEELGKGDRHGVACLGQVSEPGRAASESGRVSPSESSRLLSEVTVADCQKRRKRETWMET